MKIIPTILCGGLGTRLWPISRNANPKQFLDFFGNKTLFQQTILRFVDNSNFEKPLIICNEEHRFIVASQLQEINIQPHAIILEPTSKNTASAIAIASNYVTKHCPENLILALPADHLIKESKQFLEEIIYAQEIAQKNKIITFGIKPKSPETGFGYIEKSHPLDSKNKIFSINNFIEKPSLEIAKKLIGSNNCFWNSGIFLFNSATYLEALKNFENDIFINCQNAFLQSRQDLDFIRLKEDEFNKCRNISIDYAIMEKAQNVAVMPLELDWSDVGSWSAIAEINQKDLNQNSLMGNVVVTDTKNCYINSTSEQIIATTGIENLIIISTKDAILIANKNSSQNIKDLFNDIKKLNPDYCNNSYKTLRPWGSFEIINIGPQYKVKKIIVNPFSALSLQMHLHRAEHWVVVKGKAHVSCEDHKFTLHENESTFIPLGKKHRLENKESEILEIIEIQSGKYLEEDDIVRFNDKYGR